MPSINVNSLGGSVIHLLHNRQTGFKVVVYIRGVSSVQPRLLIGHIEVTCPCKVFSATKTVDWSYRGDLSL